MACFILPSFKLYINKNKHQINQSIFVRKKTNCLTKQAISNKMNDGKMKQAIHKLLSNRMRFSPKRKTKEKV
jgi:signal transduction histidine kinase